MAETEDHRVRVARERRHRMRARLLNGVMTSYARRRPQYPPSVEDVVEEADVSRATFYKYFNSVEEAIAAIGRELVDEMVANLISLYGDKNDAFFRLTTGIQLFMLRSVIDPQWGAFVARTDELAQDTEPLKGITAHLIEARRQGFLTFEEAEAAATLTVGTMMEAIRFMVRSGQRGRPYVEELSAMILRGLGLSMDKARTVVQERWAFIETVAPGRLSWWRDPWLKD